VDKEGFDLVSGLLDEQLSGIGVYLPDTSHVDRGRRLVELVQLLRTGLHDEHARIVEAFPGAEPAEQNALGRKLARLLQQSRVLHMLRPYVQEVVRRDIPVGLWQVIDNLISALLPHRADAVIHFDDDHNMYATLDLATAVAGTLTALGRSYDDAVHPVVFFLPGSDPTNALLMPILAHEVGHPAVEASNLGSETLKRIPDVAKLNQLLDECLKAASTPSTGQWQLQLAQWMDELLCDALATVLTGPSMLFAAATFLPAPELGSLRTHPFPADRIGFIVELLDLLGWTPTLQSRLPLTLNWCRSLHQPEGPDPRERFLRGAVQLIKPAIFEVARAHTTYVFKPEDFTTLVDPITELIESGIPSAQVPGYELTPWAITLAAWLLQFQLRGDAPKTMAAAVADSEFNLLVHKSIEMAGIAKLWAQTP